MELINKEVDASLFAAFEKVEFEGRVYAMVEPAEVAEGVPPGEAGVEVGFGRGVDLSAKPSKEGFQLCYDVRFERYAGGVWRPTDVALMVCADSETGKPIGRMFWDPSGPCYKLAHDVAGVNAEGHIIFAE